MRWPSKGTLETTKLTLEVLLLLLLVPLLIYTLTQDHRAAIQLGLAAKP